MESKLFGEVLAGELLPAIGISSFLDEEFKTQEDYNSYQEALLHGGLVGAFHHYLNGGDSDEEMIDQSVENIMATATSIQKISDSSANTNTSITRVPDQIIQDDSEITIDSNQSQNLSSSDSLLQNNSNIQIAQNIPIQQQQQQQPLQRVNFNELLNGARQGAQQGFNTLGTAGIIDLIQKATSDDKQPEQPIINVNVQNQPQPPPVVNIDLKSLLDQQKLQGLDRHNVLASTLIFD